MDSPEQRSSSISSKAYDQPPGFEAQDDTLCSQCRQGFDLEKPAPSRILQGNYLGVSVQQSALQGCSLCRQILRSFSPQSSRELFHEIVGFETAVSRTTFSSEKPSDVFLTVKINVQEVGCGMKEIELAFFSSESLTSYIYPSYFPEPTHSAAGYVTSLNTNSKETLDLIRRWIFICDLEHRCSVWTTNRSNPGFTPKRLVDLSYNGSISSTTLRLVELESRESWDYYATLSHCWGGDLAFKLVKDNLTALKKHISISDLPHTFQDAITIARKLGIRYLWIDAVCIIQDSEEDWQQQSGMMQRIYMEAYLNIAATVSKNSTEGLFRQRSLSATEPCILCSSIAKILSEDAKGNYYFCVDPLEWIRNVANAPLNSRAWVLQERLLSPRKLHFANDQIYWECMQSLASEKWPQGLPSICLMDGPQDPENIGLLLTALDFSPHTADKLFHWTEVVEKYTASSLSHQSDKVIAISALARQIALRSNLQDSGYYMAGLWKQDLSDFLDQLLWESMNSAGPLPDRISYRNYRAPSWSWASTDQPVRFRRTTPGKKLPQHLAKITEVNCLPLGDDPFGPVDSGFLCLIGWLARAVMNQQKQVEIGRELDCTIDFNRGSARGTLDHSSDALLHGLEVVCLPLRMRLAQHERLLGKLAPCSPYGVPMMDALSQEFDRVQVLEDGRMPARDRMVEILTIEGLILIPSGTNLGQFKRIGLFTMEEDSDELLSAVQVLIEGLPICKDAQNRGLKIPTELQELMKSQGIYYSITII